MASGWAKKHHWIDLVIWLTLSLAETSTCFTFPVFHTFRRKTIFSNSRDLELALFEQEPSFINSNLFEFKVKAIVKLLLETTHLARSGYHRSKVVVTKSVWENARGASFQWTDRFFSGWISVSLSNLPWIEFRPQWPMAVSTLSEPCQLADPSPIAASLLANYDSLINDETFDTL
jgi:hypothetical protein